MMGFRRILLPTNNLPLNETVEGVSLDGVATVSECLELIGLKGNKL